MTSDSELDGAIIAAGAGSRLRADGWDVPKPMVPIAGVPLIEHVIRNFVSAGVTSLVIIVNEEARECAGWVRRRFPGLRLRLVVQTTASSLESFREVTRRGIGGRMLVSTVDAWCLAADFVRFVEAARGCPDDGVVLAVTPFVADDDRPLRVRVDGSGRVTHLGGESGDLVTAGIYLVPERVRRMTGPTDLGRLRDFLRWLVEGGEPVYAVLVPAVIDVDRARDVARAEAQAHAMEGSGAGSRRPGDRR